jgi:hypothetical protein
VLPNSQSNQVLVELWLSGELWKMRLHDAGEPAGSQTLHRELGTDGESTYKVSVRNTNYVGDRIFMTPLKDGKALYRTNQGRFHSSSQGSASIIDGVVPEHFGEWGDTIVWMAYCSGCYLNGLASSNLPPWYDGNLAVTRQGLTLPAAWELEEQFPHLPQWLEYRNPGVEFSSKPGPRNNIVMYPIQTRFAYTSFTLRSRAFTNAGGWRVPLEYEARTYRSQWVTNNVFVARPSVGFFGRMIEARVLVSLAEYLPAVPHDTIVGDMRSLPKDRPQRSATYAITNRWPDPDEAQLLREERLPRPRAAPSPPDRPHIHGLPWMVTGTLIFLATAIWPLTKRRLGHATKHRTNQ